MNMVITGGGTGGHLSPALALGEALTRLRPGIEVLFIGTTAGLDEQFFKHAGVDYELLEVAGFRGRNLRAALGATAKLLGALRRARALLKARRPALVAGVGGYASMPAALAALTLRIPLVVVEQNIRPGLANRLLARFARRVCVAFEDARHFLPGAALEVTGNPIRFQPVNSPRQHPVPFSILVLGGSSGAHRLNIATVKAFKSLGKTVINLRIRHQTGKADEELVKQGYQQAEIEADVTPFIHDMAAAFDTADLVISRSGAMTVSEIALAGRAALLVPYPFHRDHQQKYNAGALERAGAALVIADDEHLDANLAQAISELLADRARVARMAECALGVARPDAAARIAQVCFEVAESKAA